MPLFDRKCHDCDWIGWNLVESADAPRVSCPACGAPTERAWLGKSATVIGDEMDHVQVNGLKTPRRFRSKQEHKRWMKANSLRINDGHVGDQGSDKNKHTARMAMMDPQTLQNAIDLVTRAAQEPARGSGDEGAIGLTSNEGIMHYLRDRSRNERGELF